MAEGWESVVPLLAGGVALRWWMAWTIAGMRLHVRASSRSRSLTLWLEVGTRRPDPPLSAGEESGE